MKIDFKEPGAPRVVQWTKKSKDGKWQLDYDRKDGKDSFWLYYFPLMFGASSATEETALADFTAKLKKHIEECQGLLAEITTEDQEKENK